MVGTGVSGGFPEPQQAVAHLGQVRHLGQGFLAEGCWCARRVCPGRGDQASLLLCSRMALPGCGGIFDMAEKVALTLSMGRSPSENILKRRNEGLFLLGDERGLRRRGLVGCPDLW